MTSEPAWNSLEKPLLTFALTGHRGAWFCSAKQARRDARTKPPAGAATSRMGGKAWLAVDVYERYEQALATRGALDFNDLISSAIRALDLDETLVENLRQRWPYILEDEAQDSSALQ